MKIYLSGAMTNEPNYRKNFNKYETLLIDKGYEVFNPVYLSDYLITINHFTDKTAWKVENRKIFLKEDIKALLDCDSIFMIPGWENSKGANIELSVAKMVGMQIFYEDTMGTL